MTQVTASDLNIIDIDNAVKIIDYACEQGAFKGWNTIRQVQENRDKLAMAVAAQQAAATALAEQNADASTVAAEEQPEA